MVIVDAYRAAIDRLAGLICGLRTRPQTRVYGLLGKAAASAQAPLVLVPAHEPAPEPRQRSLPLGPVVVVRARRPRRR